MLAKRRVDRADESGEQLLKLYSNRAGVKRELNDLRKERHELLDKLKDQEGAILRSQEQLEGLERLLTNPLAAANAMVYFQLRHLWRVGAQKVEQFGAELKTQRQQRERAQLHEAALAKRSRRLGAITERLDSVLGKQQALLQDFRAAESVLTSMNRFRRLFKGPGIRRRMNGMKAGNGALQEKIDELKELQEKIQSEALPEPDGLSIESRRLINCAIIALAQHLVAHFSDNDLIGLTKASTERPVGDMQFGDRRDCDRMVELIRNRIEDLRQQADLAGEVRRRTDVLGGQVQYRNETDSLPTTESVATTARASQAQTAGESEQRSNDAPLQINVLLDEYWDIFAVLC
jgi:hypothetical protein